MLTEATHASAVHGIDSFLGALWQARGSDLLVTSGRPPQIRVDGDLRDVPGTSTLTDDDTITLLAQMLNLEQMAAFGKDFEYDFSFSWRDDARIRGNAFRQQGSVAFCLRLIPNALPTMAELRCPAILTTFAELQQGLVLVTGPTGSGKSTTLAAMVNHINTERSCHILTIEDPIEYVHPHRRSIVNQREVGSDTSSFPSALKAALREDPDVLLVGEMRDLDSIRFALTIAETGHLVFATLHTNDTSQAMSRVIDVFPGDQQPQVRVQLAATLTGVVYQQLLPLVGGGMVAAHEVLVANSAVRNLIRDGKTHQLRNSLLTGQREGMVTLEQSLSALVHDGKVSLEDARAHSLYPKDIQMAVRGEKVPA